MTSLTTDAQGRVTSQRRYYPYGEPRAGGHGSSPTDFGFTAQRNEASFGLMDYKARYYSPVLGRFVSPDSIVPEPSSSGGFNRYRYARNSPLMYSDSTGHFGCRGCNLTLETPATEGRSVMDVYGVPAEYYVPAVESFRTYQNNPDLFLDDFAAASAGDEAAWERYNNATTYTDIVLETPYIERLLPFTEEQIQARVDSAYAEGDVVAALSHQMVLASHLGIDGFHDHDFPPAGSAAIFFSLKRPSGFRKGIRPQVEAKSLTDGDSNMICMGCGKVMSKPDLDHYPPWHQRVSKRQYNNRKELLDDFNNVDELRPLCPSCNRGHQFENTPTKQLPYYPK